MRRSQLMALWDICSLKDIEEARSILKPYIRRTPLIKSNFLSQSIAQGKVYLKLENMQYTGSFKFRGACNKIYHLSPEEKSRGVITVSAGNHAQGVALTSQLLGIPSKVVMPENAPYMKQVASKGYGADLILHGNNFNQARLYTEELVENHALNFIHPYDDPLVIAGQATIGLEILDDLWNVDTVVVPVGGGGLISGLSLALKSFNPSIHIIGVQAENVHGMASSFEEGKLTSHRLSSTLADGCDVETPGQLTFEFVSSLVDEFILVSEFEIEQAMRMLMQRAKTVTEGAGALSTAALLSGKINPKWIKDKNTVVLISGGNIDLDRISGVLENIMTPVDTSRGMVG